MILWNVALGGSTKKLTCWYSIFLAFRKASFLSLVSIQTVVEPDLISMELNVNFATSVTGFG